jgi:hypothetical protein
LSLSIHFWRWCLRSSVVASSKGKKSKKPKQTKKNKTRKYPKFKFNTVSVSLSAFICSSVVVSSKE